MMDTQLFFHTIPILFCPPTTGVWRYREFVAFCCSESSKGNRVCQQVTQAAAGSLRAEVFAKKVQKDRQKGSVDYVSLIHRQIKALIGAKMLQCDGFVNFQH